MKLKHIRAISIYFVGIMLMAAPAVALDPIPDEAGFSGFVRPGGGYLDIETNMVAEFSGFDLSADPINSIYKSNEGETTGIFFIPFNIAYTFNNLKTQIFLGTQISDLARFDLTQQLGIKQKVGNWGVMQAGVIQTGIATEVWSDPYVVGVPRITTDRDISGGQFVWDKIFGSDLELTYTFRSIDIDVERSGQAPALGLTAAQQKLLDRDGDQHSIAALYVFKIGDKHILAPSFSFNIDDRDGEARANDLYSFKLTYTFKKDPLLLVANGLFGAADYDKINPIYGIKQEDDIYGFGLTVYYKNPWDWSLWGSKPISFYVEGGYAERDADIDFYDEMVISASAGAMFRW